MAGPRRHLAVVIAVAFAVTLLAQPPAQAAPTWQPVSDLSAVGQSAYLPRVAVDEAGNSTVVWQRDDGTNRMIWSAFRPAGGSWSAPVALSSPGQDAHTAEVALDAAGNATAVWSRSNGSHDIVQSATRPAGGSWSSSVDISAVGEHGDLPQIAVDPSGNAAAMWYRSDGTHTVIQAATRPAGGSWSAPSDVSIAGQNAYGPRVVMDSEGTITAVWRRNNGVHNVIQSATRPAGGIWSAPEDLSVAGQSANTPRIALDVHGDATTVWHRWNGFHYIVQAATRPAGGVWSAPADLSVPGQSARDPQVAVDDAGNATAVWYRNNGTHHIVQAATHPAGGAWSAPTDLSTAGQDGKAPQTAIDDAGNTIAVWYRSNGTHSISQAATRPTGGAWSAPTDLSVAGQNAWDPQVVVDGAGNATSVWYREDGTQSVIQARGLDMAGPVINQFTAPTSGTAGQPVAFSVSAVDTWSTLATTAWDFGDGLTASGASVTHTYANAGNRTVTVTLTDAVGNTTTRTATINVTPAAVIPPQVNPPKITALRLKPKRIEIKGPQRKTRTTVILRLTEDAKITITLKRKGAKGKKAKQKVVLRKSLDSGRTKLRLTSKQLKRKLGKRHFKPGRYKVTVKATNSAGKDRRSVTLRVRR